MIMVCYTYFEFSFVRTSKMGMNTYLYAPKDDCKHRMYWRELYSVEEAGKFSKFSYSFFLEITHGLPT